jgi:hypothetical protein
LLNAVKPPAFNLARFERRTWMTWADALCSSLLPLQQGHLPEKDVLPLLANLTKALSVALFRDVPFPRAIEQFAIIFRSLMTTSIHDSTTVRLESSRSMSIYLSRLLPFFSDRMQEGFVRALKSIEFKTPLALATFLFISRYVSPGFMLQFVKMSLILDHFVVNDDCYVTIIEGLQRLGIPFLRELLDVLLQQYARDRNRHLVKAIGTVVKLAPPLFPKVVELKSLNLFAFLFANIDIKQIDFDVAPVIDLAFEKLSSEQISPIDLDNCYQILANLSPLCEVKVDATETGVSLEVLGHQIELPPDKFAQRSPFFLLPLPVSLIAPKPGESVLLLTAKFRTLAKVMDDANRTEIEALFRPFLLRHYGPETSAAIIGFSECVPKLRSPALINRVIYREISSWFHSFDVLRVLRRLEFQPHYLDLLYSFVRFGSVKLHVEVIETLRGFVNSDNFEAIVRFFVAKLDPFTKGEFESVLGILTMLRNSGPHLAEFATADGIATEALGVFQTDLRVLASLYRFLAGNVCSPAAVELAISIANSYYSVILGGPHDDGELFEAIEKEVQNESFDILAQIKDYSEYLPCFAASVKFVFSLPFATIGPDKAIELSDRLFPFFPHDVTQFLEVNWKELADDRKLPFLSTAGRRLEFVSDLPVCASWCRIALMTESIFTDKCNAKTIGFLHFTGALYLANQPESMQVAEVFARYLMLTSRDGEQLCQKFIESLPPASLLEFRRSIPADNFCVYQNFFPGQVDAEVEAPPNMPKFRPGEFVLPKEPEELADALELAIFDVSKSELDSLFKLIVAHGWAFSIFDYVYPSFLVPPMIDRVPVVENQLGIDKARTLWRPLIVQRHPSRYLEEALSMAKPKLATVLDLCSLVPFFDPDSPVLFDVARHCFRTSTTLKRLRPSLTLYALVLSVSKHPISREVVTDFVQAVQLETTPHYQLSLCLVGFEARLPPDLPFLQFTYRAMQLGSAWLGECRHYSLVLIRNLAEIAKLRRRLPADLEAIALDLIHAFVPSQQMRGIFLMDLGQFRGGLKSLLSIAVNSIHLPILNELAVKAIKRKKWSDRLLRLTALFAVGRNRAEFSTAMQCFLFFLRNAGPDVGQRVIQICGEIIQEPASVSELQDALVCIEERVLLAKSAQRGKAMLEFVKPWLDHLRGTDGHFTLDYAMVISKRLRQFASEQEFFEGLASNFLTASPRFFSVFPVFAKYWRTFQGCDWAPAVVSNAIEATKASCHRAALSLMKRGLVRESLDLAKFDGDCPESDVLVQRMGKRRTI